VVFSDQSFVFLFLPVALVLYFLLRSTPFALAIILITSLAFYYWSAGFQSLILVASILINFVGGLWIAARRDKLRLAVVIGADLALLIYFKYAFFLGSNLGLANINHKARHKPAKPCHPLHVGRAQSSLRQACPAQSLHAKRNDFYIGT
jgi:D-alanyl-lipoteichoic acid acyltransferase DltB (MBOAT superfamily)